MFNDENILTEISYWDLKTLEKGVIKKCKIYNDFVYCRNEFFLVGKNLNYYICIPKDGELLSVWSHLKKDENDSDYLPSEVMSIFRRKFSANGITEKDIELFKENPSKYKRTMKKRIKQKK